MSKRESLRAVVDAGRGGTTPPGEMLSMASACPQRWNEKVKTQNPNLSERGRLLYWD